MIDFLTIKCRLESMETYDQCIIADLESFINACNDAVKDDDKFQMDIKLKLLAYIIPRMIHEQERIAEIKLRILRIWAENIKYNGPSICRPEYESKHP